MACRRSSRRDPVKPARRHDLAQRLHAVEQPRGLVGTQSNGVAAHLELVTLAAQAIVVHDLKRDRPRRWSTGLDRERSPGRGCHHRRGVCTDRCDLVVCWCHDTSRLGHRKGIAIVRPDALWDRDQAGVDRRKTGSWRGWPPPFLASARAGRSVIDTNVSLTDRIDT